jgi:hypothetical protein
MGFCTSSLAVMAKSLAVTLQGSQLHIEGYPDAVAIKRIDDPIAKQLQAMHLHFSDLQFSRTALAEILTLDRLASTLLVEALWVSAIARYFKCFGGSKARSQLSAKKTLMGHDGADQVFEYFRDLRDKHIIHDDNPYSQAFAGIALNARDAEFKVADIVALALNAFTVDEFHLQSFVQLVAVTFA